MSLREQAAAAADKVELKLAFAFYAPPRYALGGADPRNLFDKTGLHPLLANFPGFGQGVDVTIAATKGGTKIIPTDDGDDNSQYLARLPLAVIHVQ